MRQFFIAIFLMAIGQPAQSQTQVGFGGTPHDSSAPIEVVSDSLEVDDTNGNAIFRGNVIAVQGDLRISAAEIHVLYQTNAETGGQNDIDQVQALGGVLITRGVDAAEAETATYFVARNEMEMVGNVLVSQQSGVIAGERMLLDIATGQGTVDGRVRTTLQGANQ